MVEEAYGSDVVFWFDEHFYGEFVIPEITARAQWYELTQWPYVRIDGSREYIGINSPEETAIIIGQMVDARLAETGGVSPVSIMGTFFPDGTILHYHVTFRLEDPVVLNDLQGTFMTIENDVENSLGDPYPRVVRSIHYEPVTFASQGEVAHFDLTLIQDSDWQTDNLFGVVFLQQTTGLYPVIQGAVLPGSPVATTGDNTFAEAPVTTIESVSPSPFRAMTEVAFRLTEAAAQGPVALQVLDPLGRQIREWSLGVGGLAPGLRTVRWDGRSNTGELVPDGTYFFRLITREGVAGGKAVYVR